MCHMSHVTIRTHLDTSGQIRTYQKRPGHGQWPQDMARSHQGLSLEPGLVIVQSQQLPPQDLSVWFHLSHFSIVTITWARFHWWLSIEQGLTTGDHLSRVLLVIATWSGSQWLLLLEPGLIPVHSKQFSPEDLASDFHYSQVSSLTRASSFLLRILLVVITLAGSHYYPKPAGSSAGYYWWLSTEPGLVTIQRQ